MVFTLRHATPADAQALARLHVRTFQETHGRGPTVALREQQWRDWLAEEGAVAFCVVLQGEAGELIGFARGVPHRDAAHEAYRGELNKIYLLRQYHRQGLGQRLLCAAAREFLARGIDSMLLFGDAASPSNAFYEAMGAERLYAPGGRFDGGYGWRDLRRLTTACPSESDSS